MKTDNIDRKPSFFRPIFLYGPPGSGKTTVGKRLAENLALPFLDLDQQIEFLAGKSIPDIFDEQGESGFRELEKQALIEVLSQAWGIIALGGGALLNADNRGLVEASGSVCCLEADQSTLLARLNAASLERPLLVDTPGETPGVEKLSQLLNQRSEHYASFSNRFVTETFTPEEIAAEIQHRLGVFHLRGMALKTSPAKITDGDMGDPAQSGYDVRVSEALDGLGAALRLRSLSGPITLVTDQNVAEYYLERAELSLQNADYSTRSIVIPPGEASKTMATISYLWQEFLASGLERKSTVVALGGGVVGDLAGFAAATYMRGIPWVNVPTTLVAMADSSLGGKTGADLPQGKNLVGAFHAPHMVLADPSTLNSLPPAELRSGMGEVVKSGVIGDPELFEMCASGWETIEDNWDAVIRKAMAVKIRVIEADPYEGGLRAVLNLGHTIGHAVEKLSNYQLRHGEAVAIGMVAEARLAEQNGLAQPGLAAQIKRTCLQLGLPVEIPPTISQDMILSAMRVDKKRADKKVKYALPVRIGKVEPGIEVSDIGIIFG
jgi:shikimate kinase/3-dehydroquinate synthase